MPQPYETIDTVVVPANEDGFKSALENDCWAAIQMDKSKWSQIKYVAVYRTAPESAITHIAPVKDGGVEVWQEDPKKVVLHFAEPLQEIHSIALSEPGKGKGLRGRRYTSLYRLIVAKTVSDLMTHSEE